MTLETDRLVLRHLSANDTTFLVELLNGPSFLQNIGDRNVRTVDDALRYLTAGPLASYRRYGFGLYMVETKESGEAIGICGLLKRDFLEDVDLGFAFLERSWGHGYAHESAAAVVDHGWRVHGLKRIVAITRPGNAASIRVLEKVGMRFERLIDTPVSGPSRLFGANRTAVLTL